MDAATTSTAKPKKQRASTSTKNRARSPSPYRSTAETHPDDFMQDFWNHTLKTAENHEDDFKHQALPLARIKKVAKMDPDVQMISSEVTVLFEKACQIFIQELTARAHLVSIESKRRTISRTDVAQAVSKSDTFDFLIDIVPREERAAAAASGSSNSTTHHHHHAATSASASSSVVHHHTRNSLAVPTTTTTTENVDRGDPRPAPSAPAAAPPAAPPAAAFPAAPPAPPQAAAAAGSTATSSKRPTRTRKISEKARQGDDGMYRDNNDDDDAPASAATSAAAGGGYDVAVEYEAGAMATSDDVHAAAENHVAKKSRVELGPPRAAGHGHGDVVDEDEDEDGEDDDEDGEDEDEDLEGDGAFEGWDGLELGFK
ncbi:hypothetical protein JCM11491_006891 [Sporobolomyces phaffii]